ncbi:MAG: BON domain-containing protein [Hydrogenophilus sp.]|nr:BON domain-containing protein [Hydrogenophilus sp.]
MNRWLSLLLLFPLLLPLAGCFPAVATGVAVTASIAADRRTSGAIVEDERLEWALANDLQKAFGDKAHINVTSFNRVVLLTGEVPDAATKERADVTARTTPNVRAVVNELIIAPPSTLGARANDVNLATQVKARLVGSRDLSAHLIKVTAENGVVYLMGLVTRREADIATQIARTTAGVKRVVRVFELIDEAEAKRLDQAAQTVPNRSPLSPHQSDAMLP